jgi:hypothetical protein
MASQGLDDDGDRLMTMRVYGLIDIRSPLEVV